MLSWGVKAMNCACARNASCRSPLRGPPRAESGRESGETERHYAEGRPEGGVRALVLLQRHRGTELLHGLLYTALLEQGHGNLRLSRIQYTQGFASDGSNAT
jgi:hypothetical protein